MIEVSGLRKEFGEVTAVAGVSFTAQPAEIFGLLGPNGAGQVRVQGHDVVHPNEPAPWVQDRGSGSRVQGCHFCIP